MLNFICFNMREWNSILILTSSYKFSQDLTSSLAYESYKKMLLSSE